MVYIMCVHEAAQVKVLCPSYLADEHPPDVLIFPAELSEPLTIAVARAAAAYSEGGNVRLYIHTVYI